MKIALYYNQNTQHRSNSKRLINKHRSNWLALSLALHQMQTIAAVSKFQNTACHFMNSQTVHQSYLCHLFGQTIL